MGPSYEGAISVIEHLVYPNPNAGLFGGSEALWVSLAASVSAAAAAATFWLAFITRGLALATQKLSEKTAEMTTQTASVANETRDLVNSSAEDRAQVERHHQETLAPLLVVEADLVKSNTEGEQVALQGYLRNIGGGPAREAWIYIRPSLAAPAQFSVRPIAAGDRWELSVGWAGVLEARTTAYPYDLLVTFVTVFGTRGAIEYKSHSGIRDDLSVERVVSPSSGSHDEVVELEQKYRALKPVLARGTVGPR
jgi:hypothetical protein